MNSLRYEVARNLQNGSTSNVDDNTDISTKQLINDGIVFSTAAILIIALVIWIGIFLSRSCAKPIKSNNANSLTDIRNLTSKNLQENNEKIETMKKKSKKVRKKKGSKAGSVYSESQSGDGSQDSSTKPTENTHLLETPTTKEAAGKLREFWQESDKINRDYISSTMRATFTRVMSDGMTLTLHTQKGPKNINMVLNGNEIFWKTSKMFPSRKQYKLNLREIVSVKLGKDTPNFKLPSAASVPEDTCFSLLTDKITVDLQLSSKVERDAVAQGFASFVNEFKQGV